MRRARHPISADVVSPYRMTLQGGSRGDADGGRIRPTRTKYSSYADVRRMARRL